MKEFANEGEVNAYDDGYEEGYNIGYKEGKKEGWENGKEELIRCMHLVEQSDQ